MKLISLRGVISTIAAVTVALVAALTLSITLSSSLSALRDVGRGYAMSLLVNAQLRSEQYLAAPQDACDVVRNFSMSRDWAWPSDDPTTFAEFSAVTHTHFIGSHGVLDTLFVFFHDNTRIGHQNTYEVGREHQNPTDYYISPFLRAPSITAAGGNLTAQGDPALDTDVWYVRNHTTMARTHPLYGSLAPAEVPAKFAWTAFWNNSLVFPTGQGTTRLSVPAIASSFRGKVQMYLSYASPLYRKSDPVGPSSLFGFAVAVIAFGDLSTFMRDARGTPNTEAFIIDALGYLMAGSTPAPIRTSYNASASDPVPTGCASTASVGTLATGGAFIACRARASEYGYKPLAQLYADRGLAFAPRATVTTLRVDGDLFFAASAPIPQRYRGNPLQLLLLMPEADVIGDVITSRNTAIGVTCAVFAVVAALIFLAISQLLAPLQTLADRMVDAANFEDDTCDDQLSAMAEVAQLQEAYYAMNNELNRIRAFVPHSVLATRHERPEDLEDEDLMQDVNAFGVSMNSAPRKVMDPTTESTRSTRSTQRSAGAAAADLTALAIGVTTKRVVILVANACGFAEVAAQGSAAIVRNLDAVVSRVTNEVQRAGGVMSYFHGDQFVATFNAVRHAAAAERKAAMVALSMVQAADGGGLRITSGIASGHCYAGYVGNPEHKGFSVIGPAFLQALVLERLTRYYRCDVMASARVCADVALHVRFRVLDIVPLPGRPAALVAALLEPVRRADEAHPDSDVDNASNEWLYVLQRAAANDINSHHNSAFEALHRMELDVCDHALDDDSLPDNVDEWLPPHEGGGPPYMVRDAAARERLAAMFTASWHRLRELRAQVTTDEPSLEGDAPSPPLATNPVFPASANTKPPVSDLGSFYTAVTTKTSPIRGITSATGQ